LACEQGWSSWNAFHGGISEGLLHNISDLLVSTGLAKAGYTYVNIDGEAGVFSLSLSVFDECF
jgi:alpha-galactosidase